MSGSGLWVRDVSQQGDRPAVPDVCPECQSRWRIVEHLSVGPPHGNFRGVIVHCVQGHRHAYGSGRDPGEERL